MKKKLYGLDISAWQGDVNFNSLEKNQDFVIIKATEGVGFKDSKYDEYNSELKRLNIPRGYYHFARPDLHNTPKAEVDWFLSVVGNDTIGSILVLDFEVNIPNPVEWCLEFLNHLSDALNGYKGVVYLNMYTVKGHDWSEVVNKNYSLWLAYWDYDPNGTFEVPHWNTVAMRQYSNNGKVNGIEGRVDLNVFYGDLDQLYAYGVSTGDIPCEKLKLENERLKSDKIALQDQNKELQDSLDGLNDLYKKLLAEDKIEDEEMEKLLEDFDDLTKMYKDQSDIVFEKDKLIQDQESKIERLDSEVRRLKRQEFTIGESIVFFVRAIRGGDRT